MDRKEYLFYSLRSPDEYFTEYGRGAPGEKELGKAVETWDKIVENYRKQKEFERKLEERHPLLIVDTKDGRVAQLDVQRSSKPKVEGSNPSTPTNKFDDLIIE